VSGRARRALALLVAGAMAWGPWGPASAAAQGACPGCVVAGAGRAPLTVPAGTPLAGYGAMPRRLLVPDVLDRYPHAFWLKPGRPERDGLAARALVLERDGTRVIWVAVDLIAVDRAFTETVTARLARAAGPPAVLVISASHTHSGPGAFLDSALLGFLAADREDAAVREAVVAAVIEAVRRADDARGPARVAVGLATAPAVVRSRLGGPLDPEVVVLAVRRPSGAPVALVWNFAIHGTMLGPGNLRLSADVMGAASETLEQALHVPALFVNGAVGDVSPASHGPRALVDVAQALAPPHAPRGSARRRSARGGSWRGSCGWTCRLPGSRSTTASAAGCPRPSRSPSTALFRARRR